MRRRRLNQLPQAGSEQVIKTKNATTSDALRIIEDVADLSARTPEIVELAGMFKNYSSTYELAEDLANFVFRSAYFEPDSTEHQRVKSSVRILRDGKTNCVGYSTLISSILNVLGLPHTLRLVDTGNGGFDHIYPMLDGIAIDVVPCQSQHGDEHLTRSINSYPEIGKEVPHVRKFDLLITPHP